jgi:hypothetical protein
MVSVFRWERMTVIILFASIIYLQGAGVLTTIHEY